MAENDPRPLTRAELAEFLPTQRAIRAFEKLFDIIPPDLIEINTYLDAIRLQPNNVNADYTVPDGNFLVLVDATTAPVTITLPDATMAFFEHHGVVTYYAIGVSKIDTSANAVTIIGQPGQTVVKESSQTLLFVDEIINLVANPNTANWELAS